MCAIGFEVRRHLVGAAGRGNTFIVANSRLSLVPKVHPETGAQKVQGRWLAATSDDRLHRFEDEQGVSQVGERIMELVDGKRSVSDIVAVICEEFEVGKERCETDALRFIESCVEKQILEW